MRHTVLGLHSLLPLLLDCFLLRSARCHVLPALLLLLLLLLLIYPFIICYSPNHYTQFDDIDYLQGTGRAWRTGGQRSGSVAVHGPQQHCSAQAAPSAPTHLGHCTPAAHSACGSCTTSSV